MEKKSEKKSNKKKSKPWVVVLSVVVIAVIIVLLIIFWKNIFPEEDVPDEIYNGYIFTETPPMGMWNVTVKTSRGDAELEFYYHPQELEMLPYDENFTEAFRRVKIRNGKFFVGYDVNFSYYGMAAVAGAEVAKITGPVLRVETRSGLLDSIGNESDIPVYNCSKANSQNLIIELRIGENNSFSYNDYCAVIYAASHDEMVMMTDLTAYHLLGIMPNRMN
ncbi:MAG: hypothetical protein ACP5N3_03865 [Candidatus Nanoarchaeia archaeon]